MRRSGWLRVLGLATVAGVAAGGAVVARDQRKRKAYTADEVRERLRRRHAEISDARASTPGDAAAQDGPPTDA